MNILVVCSGNICRSPMAEGILAHLLGERALVAHEVRSAGTLGIVGAPPSDEAIEACEERGIDIAAKRSVALTPALITWSDLVLCMEEHHRKAVLQHSAQADRVLLLGRFDPGQGDPEIADPVGTPLANFRACRDLLWACLTALLDELA